MDNNVTPAPLQPPVADTLPAQRAGWRLDALAVGVLFLLPLLVLLPAALVRGVFFIHDVQYYFYPYHALPAALLGRGELPLWNAYAFSGLPIVGDGQTALFYPPSWLFFALPGAAALNYDILLQFGIAGAGMYLFARSLGLDRLPALAGALSFMFCGFMTARVVHLSIMSGVALIPLAFCCVERAMGATWNGRQETGDRRQETGDRTSPQLSGSSSIVHRRSPSSVLGPTRLFVAAAGAVGLQAVAGHPQIPVYTALALGLYVLVRAVERWRSTGSARWLYRLPLMLAGIYLLGYALAAIQLVPWIELGAQSPRAAGASFDFVFGNSTAGGDWLLFLFPYLYGALQAGIYADQAPGIATQVRLWEHSAYAGILPLALAAYALLGLARTKEPAPAANSGSVGRSSLVFGRHIWYTTLFFGLLLLGAVLFSAGKHTPLASLIYVAPVVGKLRDVERAMALADFALAALAAIGMQRALLPRHASDTVAGQSDKDVRHQGAKTPRISQRSTTLAAWRPALLVLAALLVLVPAGVVWAARQPWFVAGLGLSPAAVANLDLGRANAAAPLALALLSAALLLWWSGRRASPASQWLAIGLLLLDLGGYAAQFNPLAEPELYARQPEVLRAFASATGPFRKATFLLNNDPGNRAAQETLAVSWGMVYGVEDINGFNSLQPRRYTDYLFGPEVGDVSYGYLTDARLLRAESPILSALNVRFLLVPAGANPPLGPHLREVYRNAEVGVYENTLAYPRAFFADAVRAESDPQAVLRAVTADGFDGRRLALVEGGQPPALAPASGPANATITELRANRIAITTQSAAPRLLVLSEMFFPGWRAYVDGVETAIYRTNYLFRGVAVPAGQHTVVLEYRPLSVLLGAAISALALVLVVALLWMPGRRSSKPNADTT